MRFFAGIAAAFEMPLADVILIEEQCNLREDQDTEEPTESKWNMNKIKSWVSSLQNNSTNIQKPRRHLAENR